MIHLDVTTIERDELLTAAIAGLEIERARLQARIDEVRAELSGDHERVSLVLGSAPPPADKPKRGRPAKAHRLNPNAEKRSRRVTAAGRARIAEAQKKRWAAYHKARRKAA